jgi:hypothetical protein
MTEQQAAEFFGQKLKRKYTRKAKDVVQSLAAQQTSNATPELILGWEVYWTISAKTLSIPDMQALINRTLGTSFMPRQPKAKVKLRRAMDAISATGDVKKIKEEDDMIYYALVNAVPDKENIDIDLEKEAIAAYDKKADKLSFRGGSPEAQQAIRDTFSRFLLEFDEFQIRQVAADYINANGAVRMRKDGKIYFIRTFEHVERLESYINALDNDSEFYYLPILDLPVAKKQMINIVQRGLETDIEELAEEVKRMSEAKFTRGDTLIERFERFKAMRKKCEAYSDMLQTNAESLAQRVDQLRDEVRQAIEGEEVIYPQRDAFPRGAEVEYSGAAVEKFGKSGRVVGYFNSKSGKPYVKIKFFKTQTISPCAPSSLKVVSSSGQ